ncbi:MAG: lipopolysaccharide biosynthesis protein [Pirellulales bacterium]
MSDRPPSTDSKTARAFYLALGRMLSSVLGLVGYAILSRLLDKTEYATYRQALLVLAVAAPLLMFGLPETLYYVLPRSAGRRRAKVQENFLLLLVAAACFAAFLLLGGNDWFAHRAEGAGPGLATALLWLAPLTLFTIPTEGVGPVLVVAGQAPRLAIYQVVTRGLTLAATIGAVLFWRPTGLAAVAGAALAALFTIAAAVWLLHQAFQDDSHPSRRGMLEQWRYAMPLGLGSAIAGWMFSYDKVAVGRLCTPEQFADYVNGAWEIPLIGILAGSTTAVLWPEMTRLFQEERNTEMLALWRRAATKSACVTFPLFLYAFAHADETIAVLYPESYGGSVVVFRVYLLLILLRVAAWTVVPQATNRPWQVLIVTLAGLAAMFGLSGWAIERLGPVGAAWTLVAMTAGVLVPGYGWLTSRAFHCSPWRMIPWGDLFRAMLLSALPCGLFAIKAIPGLPALLILILSAILYFPCCYFLLTRYADCPRVAILERLVKG